MTKRIKPGYDVRLPNDSRVYERDGYVVFENLDLGPETTEALAAALADAVEDAPRELWEVAYDAHFLTEGDPEGRCTWQPVVDAVLAAHAERERAERAAEGSHEMLARWAVYRHGVGYVSTVDGERAAWLDQARMFASAEGALRHAASGDQLIRVIIRGAVER